MEISLLLDSKSIFGITILNLSALKFHINYFFLYFTYFFITGIFYSINKISNSKDITSKTVYTKIGNDSQIYTRDQPFQKVIILLGKHTQVFSHSLAITRLLPAILSIHRFYHLLALHTKCSPPFLRVYFSISTGLY